jgi:hypothetical protein
MTTKMYDNKVEHGSVNVPGKPTTAGSAADTPADSGATSTQVNDPSTETAATAGPDAAKGLAFKAPATSALKPESSHMPGSDATPHS